MPYQGQEDATRDRVRQYLVENYTEPDGTSLSPARLTELLTDYARILERGIAVRSYAYYVGDAIGDAARLVWAGDDGDE